MEYEKKYFAGWWLWIVLLLVITGGIFAALKPFGMWWDRQVMLESHQYKEARNTELMAYQAQLAEINSRLSREKDENVRNDLLSQKSMLNQQISIAQQRKMQ